MKTDKPNIKEVVRVMYDKAAQQNSDDGQTSCCGGATCCGNSGHFAFNDDYSGVEGYLADADLGLGCGIPSDFANLQTGDTVLDLGSGAGNDCFVARKFVGEEGYVFGLDFSDKMLNKALENQQKLGYRNIEFKKGDIEDMPFESGIMDKVLSNCVLNLVPDKVKAFKELFRVLKPNGSFCISDVVLNGNLPESVLKDAEMYAGCISGAVEQDEYLEIIKNAGFSNIQIHKKKEIVIPDDTLLSRMSSAEIDAFRHSDSGIFSITVTAKKY